MLQSIQTYNALTGVVTREELSKLAEELRHDEQYHPEYKINAVLDKNPDKNKFDVSVDNKAFEQCPASLQGAIEYIPIPEDEEFTGLNKAVSADSIYQMVTDKILAQLKASVDFKQTWNGGDKEGYMYAYNFVTKNPYTSINQVILGAATNPNTGDFELLKNPYFLTFKQVEKLKGKVVKGAKAHQVIYYTTLYKYEQAGPKLNFGTYDKDRFINWVKKNSGKINVLNETFTDMNGKESSIGMDSFVHQCIYPILKYYNVFSGSDITGIDFKLDEFKGVGFIEKTGLINDVLPAAEAIIENYPDPKPALVLGGDVASYNRMKDVVNMPKIKFFDNSQAYYTTMFHEYIHSTGSKERLGRKKGKKFADKDYAFEELVAEIGASFLSANAGILHYTLRNGAAYIKGWHENLIILLEEDNRFIFKASTLAQKAADFILQPDKNGVPKFLKGLKKEPKKTVKSKAKKSKPTVKSTPVKVDKNGQFGLFGVSKNPDTIAYNKQIKKAAIKGFKDNQVFILGKPKAILSDYLPELEIKHNGRLLRKAILEKHSLNWGHFIDLSDKLNNPDYIFKSTSNNDNDLVVVVSLVDVNNNKVVVALNINRLSKRITVKSIYGKENKDFIKNWINSGLLLYNKKSASKPTRTAPIAAAGKKAHDKDTKKGLNAPNIDLGYNVVESKPNQEKPLHIEPIPIINEVKSTIVAPLVETPVAAKKEVKVKVNNSLVKNLTNTKYVAKDIKQYNIGGDISEFLGDLEIKPKDSLAITIDAEQGAGKTRFVFQLLNEFAGSGYKCLFVSLEEHPESKLFNDKVSEYINPENEHLIDTIGELPNWYKDLAELIPHYDCIFIDSWSKIAEEDRTVDFDKHLRKGFDSKLFVTIFQRTTNGTMRGGTKSAFDGDVILKMEKAPDYKNSYVYANKNRYQNKPLDSLKYNIYTKSLMRENEPTTATTDFGFVVAE